MTEQILPAEESYIWQYNSAYSSASAVGSTFRNPVYDDSSCFDLKRNDSQTVESNGEPKVKEKTISFKNPLFNDVHEENMWESHMFCPVLST